MEPTVLTIIVTYNAMPWVDRCLTSLINSSNKTDIHIYDNGSTDNTTNHIRNNYPEAKLFITGDNLGFGKANNIGIKHALTSQYQYVVLLNQDAWVFENTLSNLIKASQNNKEFGILSPLHYSESDNLEYHFNKYISKNHSLVNLLSETNPNLENKIFELPFINAAIWLLPIKTIETIGGFDPIFPHYGEDDDFINRLHYHNLKVGVVPNSKGIHARKTDTPPSIKQLKYFEFIHYLVRLKNLNFTLTDSLIYSFKKIGYYSIAELLKLQFSRLFTDIRFSIQIIQLIPHLKRNRKISKTKAPSFL